MYFPNSFYPIEMLFYLLLVPVVLFLALFVLLYLRQVTSVRKVYNVKTGATIPFVNIFYGFYMLGFGNKDESLFIQSSKSQRSKGNILLSWIFINPIVQVRTPEYANYILKNTQIFEKTFPISFKEQKEFIGEDQLVFVNGHNWVRQRKILDPAFIALQNYEKIFHQKTNIVLKRLQEKEGIISNTTDLTQKMALDILGLSIFGHDFNSLLGSSEKDLEAYNMLMESMNTPSSTFYYLFKDLIFPWHENTKLREHLKVFNDLAWKLIEESKNSKSNNISMLDMMVASQNRDDGLSDQEIRDNIA